MRDCEQAGCGGASAPTAEDHQHREDSDDLYRGAFMLGDLLQRTDGRGDNEAPPGRRPIPLSLEIEEDAIDEQPRVRAPFDRRTLTGRDRIQPASPFRSDSAIDVHCGKYHALGSDSPNCRRSDLDTRSLQDDREGRAGRRGQDAAGGGCGDRGCECQGWRRADEGRKTPRAISNRRCLVTAAPARAATPIASSLYPLARG